MFTTFRAPLAWAPTGAQETQPKIATKTKTIYNGNGNDNGNGTTDGHEY